MSQYLVIAGSRLEVISALNADVAWDMWVDEHYPTRIDRGRVVGVVAVTDPRDPPPRDLVTIRLVTPDDRRQFPELFLNRRDLRKHFGLERA